MNDPESGAGYETHAARFLHHRDGSTVGARVVEQWARSLPRGAEVLEIACGGGLPVTRALVREGLKVWAIDASQTLVVTFRTRFPDVPVRVAIAQESDFFGRRFDGVIAIGLMFLLPEDDQLTLIRRVPGVLRPGGRLLFSAPTEVGTWTDVATQTPCLSLGRVRYEQALTEAGLFCLTSHVDEGGNHHYAVVRGS